MGFETSATVSSGRIEWPPRNSESLCLVAHGPAASSVTLVGVENNNFEDQGQRNAKTLMNILRVSAILP
jgi:hypothetical protein